MEITLYRDVQRALAPKSWDNIGITLLSDIAIELPL